MLAGRPDAGADYLLCGTCPGRKVAAMCELGKRLIEEMAGPEPTPPQAPPAEAAGGAVMQDVAL